MKFMKANGLVIHHRDQGRRDGPPLVFINSLGTDFRIWNEVAEILAPDFRIVLHDKRGHGLSESGPDQSDIADYARDLAALLDGVGVGRATIVGLSIGGLIAQELYRQSPERVSALVLCDTTAKIGTEEVWDQRIGEVQRGGIEALADAVMGRWFTAHFRAARSAELAGMRAMLTRTPRQGYLAACGALKRADLRPYAGRIQAPTLCLVGDQDGSTPPALVKETAALIPGSRFEIIEGAGHLPNVEKPEIVAKLVAEHAKRAAS
jgi:3-oxoadipate enol-lactonase